MFKLLFYLILISFLIYIDNKGFKLLINIRNIFISLYDFKTMWPDFYKMYGKNYLNLYIITHKDFKNDITNKFYKILCDNPKQLNSSYPLEIIFSNKGNELYSRKKGYSEGSKMFYIWKQYKNKKITSKYVGFNHYRRIFSFVNNIPNLEKIFKNYDVILNNHVILNMTIKEQYYENHNGDDIESVLNIIKEKFPDYYKSALKVLNSTKIYFCNIFIMKSDDFIKYGNFVFPTLLEFDKKYKFKNDNDVKNYVKTINKYKKKNIYNKTYEKIISEQRRLEGYLLERLSNIFYYHHFKKIYEVRFQSKRKKIFIKILEIIVFFLLIFSLQKERRKNKKIENKIN